MTHEQTSEVCPTCGRSHSGSREDVWADVKLFLFELTSTQVPGDLQASWTTEHQTHCIAKGLELLELVYSPGMEIAKAREIAKHAVDATFKSLQRQRNAPRQRVGRPWDVRPT